MAGGRRHGPGGEPDARGAARGAPAGRVRGRELTLAFPAGAAFLKRKAEQDEHRRVATEACQAVTGSALALRYELPGSDRRGGRCRRAEALSGEELVRRFMEEFDAEEILDDDSGRRQREAEA